MKFFAFLLIEKFVKCMNLSESVDFDILYLCVQNLQSPSL